MDRNLCLTTQTGASPNPEAHSEPEYEQHHEYPVVKVEEIDFRPENCTPAILAGNWGILRSAFYAKGILPSHKAIGWPSCMSEGAVSVGSK